MLPNFKKLLSLRANLRFMGKYERMLHSHPFLFFEWILPETGKNISLNRRHELTECFSMLVIDENAGKPSVRASRTRGTPSTIDANATQSGKFRVGPSPTQQNPVTSKWNGTLWRHQWAHRERWRHAFASPKSAQFWRPCRRNFGRSGRRICFGFVSFHFFSFPSFRDHFRSRPGRPDREQSVDVMLVQCRHQYHRFVFF